MKKIKQQEALSYSQRRKLNTGDKIFQFVNATILVFFAILCLLPFLNVIGTSFASQKEIYYRPFIIIPEEFTLDAYKYILSSPDIFRAMALSVVVTVVGTLISISLTSTMAYALSRKYLRGRKELNFLVLFTMLFSGGMIPTFLVVNALQLIDTLWALILPGAISAYNLIIMRNFFQAIPESMEEAVKIDGGNDWDVFSKIMLPLAIPSLATVSLFYAVNYWNNYSNSVLYINDSSKWTMQVLLRQIVIVSSGVNADASAVDIVPPDQSVKMAVIVIATIPMLIVYPFIQRYFVKGVMVGSIKG